MAQTNPKLTTIDPVWQRICQEAEAAIRDEPLIGGFVHSSVLHHTSLENALAYRISMKLASSEMSDQMLREIADRAYAADPSCGSAGNTPPPPRPSQARQQRSSSAQHDPTRPTLQRSGCNARP